MAADDSPENVLLNMNFSQQVLNSLDPACNELKHAYDACFNAWFTESYLKGQHKGRKTPCDEMLSVYSECVKAAMQAKNIKLDLPSERQLLDAAAMKPEPEQPKGDS